MLTSMAASDVSQTTSVQITHLLCCVVLRVLLITWSVLINWLIDNKVNNSTGLVLSLGFLSF